MGTSPAREAAETGNHKKFLDVVPDPHFEEVAESFSIGLGVKVAIIDSGLSLRSPVRAHTAAICDFTDEKGRAEDTTEKLHGTTVAEVVHRYAPGARLVVAKVGIDLSRMSALSVAKALTWAVDQGAKVINLSSAFRLRRECTEGTCPICTAIKGIVALGVVVVVAGGNKQEDLGLDKIRCPAVSPYALTVGAIGVDGNVADYSVFGRHDVNKPDIMAPGRVIFRSGRQPVEGTSFAAPVMAAAVALLGAKIGYPEAAQLLQETASPMAHIIYPTGHGKMDLQRAMMEVATHEGLAGSTQGQV